MPCDLAFALEHAHRVLDWQEHLTSEEMPPEWMWPLDEAIVEWMERITEERKERAGGGSSSRDERETVPMMQNEYARGRR